MGLDFDSIRIAQLGQALCVAVSGVVYVLGWHKYFTNKPAARVLGPGENLACSGFSQVFRTFGAIWKHYRGSLGYFLLAVMVGQAGTLTSLHTFGPYLFITSLKQYSHTIH